MPEGSVALNFFDAEKDKPRNRSMVKMRVSNRNTGQLTLPCGNLIPPGVHEVLVYEDEAPAVLAMVERQPEYIELARVSFRGAIATEVQRHIDWSGDMDLLRHHIEQRDNPQITAVVTQVLEQTESSVEGEFYRLTNRSLLPLDSAEIIETGLAEPQRRGQAAEQEKLVGALHAIFGPGQAQAGLQAMVDAQVDAKVKAAVAAALREHGIASAPTEPKPPQPRKQ